MQILHHVHEPVGGDMLVPAYMYGGAVRVSVVSGRGGGGVCVCVCVCDRAKVGRADMK